MATDVVSPSLPIRAAKQMTTHPLAPVSADEIKQAVSFIRAQWPADTDLHFKCITLQEPAKAEVVPYIEAEANGQSLPGIDRRAMVTYYIRKTVSFLVRLGFLSLPSDRKSRTNFMKLLST